MAEGTLGRSPRDDLVQMYFTSVSRNSKLPLNVPPGREGLFHRADVASLMAIRARLDALCARNLVVPGSARFTPRGDRSAVAEIALRPAPNVGIIDLREDIAQSQRVAAYRIEVQAGRGWREVVSGFMIGYGKLEQVSVGAIQRLRVTTEDSADLLLPLRVGCYGAG